MNNAIRNILESVENANGKCLYIGGCVRDELFGAESKDIDVEVYGVDVEKLVDILSSFGKVDQVGKSFGVIKLTADGQDYDFTLPRRDNCVGSAHTDFEVEVDHSMTPTEAAKRRDFTINAIGMGLDGDLIDPFGGRSDLRDGILRATSEHYKEDALRVLRGMQFCGRFGLVATQKTVAMSQSMIEEGRILSYERIREEWIKWALKSVEPSMGLAFLSMTKWTQLYPELEALENLAQEEEWHPEGCVYTHTALVCDAAATIASREELGKFDRLILMLAALCHDLGKASTTAVVDGRIVAPGHDIAGEEPTRALLNRLGFLSKEIIEPVVALVKNHMAHLGMEVNPRTVRRLADRVSPSSILMLSRLAEADHSGRCPLPAGRHEKWDEILEVAAELEVEKSKPKPIVMGRHLIEAGYNPGPSFSDILSHLYDEQLDGSFHDVESGIALL